MEHVRSCARRKQQVQVRVDCTTWLIEPPVAPHLLCSGCSRPIDYAVCRRRRGAPTAYCVACALAQPLLTVAFLQQLPADAVLRDVQAHYLYGGQWAAWTRWPQATPAEIMDDMRLQRRFAPVLTWRCAEIRLRPQRATDTMPSTGTPSWSSVDKRSSAVPAGYRRLKASG
jgi:hypothetical protein